MKKFSLRRQDSGLADDNGDGGLSGKEEWSLMTGTEEDQNRVEVDGPLREPLMPRVSIRSIIVLTAVSAVLMVIAQQGLVEKKMWAMAVTVTLVLAAVLFALYAITFIWANPLSLLSSSVVGPEDEENLHQHSPTLSMPEEWVPPSVQDGDATVGDDTNESENG